MASSFASDLRWVLRTHSCTNMPARQQPCCCRSASPRSAGTAPPGAGSLCSSPNLFSGNTFKDAESCAMDRAKMLTGAVATQQCCTTGTSYGGLPPADNADWNTPADSTCTARRHCPPRPSARPDSREGRSGFS